MADPENETVARFAAIVETMMALPGVRHVKSGSWLSSSSMLMVDDKIFAMVSSSGQFVVKLPKARVDARVGTRAGERFDSNRDRPMNEWLEVRSGSAERWLQLAREAFEFVGS